MDVVQRAIKAAESSTVRVEDTELQKWINLEIVNHDLAEARKVLARAQQN